MQQMPAAGADLELVAAARPADPGMKISHTPDGTSLRIGCTRPSQRLKSPMTLTRCAFGAQTAKCTPVTPSIVTRWLPSFSHAR